MSDQEFRLELPFRIKMVNASADVDVDFGPYESVEDANEQIKLALRKVGKFVGIYQDGKLSFYAYQGGVADEDLKPVLGGELRKIGNGYGLQHQIDNPDNYGTLGNYAVNFSNGEHEGDYGATGWASHAEGTNTTASGGGSHAEGLGTKASAQTSHAEGYYTTASGFAAHAEGDKTVASGQTSHAEGDQTTASGTASHAEGYNTTASGMRSHAEGSGTIAGSLAENARGLNNEIIPPISATGFEVNDVIESVGVGTSNSTRKNALTRWKNGAWKWLLQPLTNITNAVLGFHAADEDGRLNYHNGTEWKKYALEGEGGSKKEFIGEYANPHTTDIVIDTTQFMLGDEWIITYNGAAFPTITLDDSKEAKLINVGVDFEANVANRIYLHLVEISGTDYYFDVTATPITLL